MATIFYGRDNLQEKVQQKIISLLTRTQVLNKNDNVQAVLGSTILWGINDCILALDNQLVCFKNSKGISHERYNYSDISSASLEKIGMFERICLSIGGSKNVVLDVSATQDGTKAMYEFIIGKIREVRGKEKSTTSNEVSTNADEILKYKQLLDMGAITTEEYERKKKQLLGI